MTDKAKQKEKTDQEKSAQDVVERFARKPYDMIRWGYLKSIYKGPSEFSFQKQLDQLFNNYPVRAEHKPFQELVDQDGDVLPYIKKAQAVWDEIANVGKSASSFKAAFEELTAPSSNTSLYDGVDVPPSEAEQVPTPYDYTRVTLMVWYDLLMHPRPLLGQTNRRGCPLKLKKLVFINVLGRTIWPSVTTVMNKARELVEASLASEHDDVKYQYAPKRVTTTRFTEALVQDLKKEFELKAPKNKLGAQDSEREDDKDSTINLGPSRRTIQLRLNASVFSLSKDYPGLCNRIGE